jgi:DNA-binding MarR family transcriptional regulator
MKTPDIVPPGDRSDALRALRALVASLGQSARAIEGRTGFTNAQLFLLQQLAEAGPMSVSALAARARTRPNTVSTVLGRLVSAGLVQRTRSWEDQRRAELSLSARARQLLKRAPRAPTEALISALESLPDGDARALARGLTALTSALDITITDPPILFQADQPARTPRRRTRAHRTA